MTSYGVPSAPFPKQIVFQLGMTRDVDLRTNRRRSNEPGVDLVLLRACYPLLWPDQPLLFAAELNLNRLHQKSCSHSTHPNLHVCCYEKLA